MGPLAHDTTIRETKEVGRVRGHHADRFLDGDQLATVEAVAKKGCGVVGAAHAIEVGTSVGSTDHDPRVPPDLDPRLPRGIVGVGGLGPQDRAQIVSDHDVEEGVEV